MPDQSVNDLVTLALGELQLRVLVLTAEKALLEQGIAALKKNVVDHMNRHTCVPHQDEDDS